MTVLRSASTSPSGEPKRKKPDTLKSRRLPAPSAPSSAAELPRGASASSGASLGCRLQQQSWWVQESQRCTLCSPVSPEELLEAGKLQQGTAPLPCSLPGWCRSKVHPLQSLRFAWMPLALPQGWGGAADCLPCSHLHEEPGCWLSPCTPGSGLAWPDPAAPSAPSASGSLPPHSSGEMGSVLCRRRGKYQRVASCC